MRPSDKSTWRRIVALGALIPAFGCTDLLVESPSSTIVAEQFYRSASDAIAAVNGAYDALHHNLGYIGGTDYVYMLETPTPHVTPFQPRGNQRFGCYDAFNCHSGSQNTRNAWEAIYIGINRANAVIHNVAEIENMDASLRARVVAEARYLRAFHYFNLVRLFGGVPLWDAPASGLFDLAVPRAPADEVYQLITQDLIAAKADLPLSYESAEFGRATSGAAATLLGKVYLHRGIAGRSNPFADPLYWPTAQPSDLENAISELRSVIASGEYILEPEYATLFNEESEQNQEVIWAVVNTFSERQGLYVTNWLNPPDAGWGNSWGVANGELPFYQSYAESDERREVSWLTEYTDLNGDLKQFDPDDVNGDTYPVVGPGLRKYIVERVGVGAVSAAVPLDRPVLRYADVLLMLAEALNEQNGGPTAEAYDLVNQVRARAEVDPLPEGLGYEGFREALYHERNWEFTQEQHAWYDAPRFWDLFTAQVVEHAQLGQTNPQAYPTRTVPRTEIVIEEPKHRLMPINSGVLSRNPALTQNPGYSD